MSAGDTSPRRTMGLGARFGFLALACVVISTGTVAYLALTWSRAALEPARVHALEAIASGREAAVAEILRAQLVQAAQVGAMPAILQLATRRDDTPAALPEEVPEPADVERDQAAEPAPEPVLVLRDDRRQEAVRTLQSVLPSTSFEWIAVVDASGEVLASTSDDVTVDEGLLSSGATFSPIRTGLAGRPLYRLRSPIDDRGRRTASVVAEARAEPIWDVLTDRQGLGSHGESYLVGPGGGFLSPTLFHASGGPAAPYKGGGVARMARGDELGGRWTAYHGEAVLGFVAFERLRAVGAADWGVVVELDAEDAFAPVDGLVNEVVLAGVAFGLLALVLGVLTARSASNSLRRITTAAERIGRGDLTTPPQIERRGDEIGALSRAMVAMHTERHDLLAGLRDQLTALVRHASQVSDAARMYAAVASHQSEAVETTKQSLNETKKSSASTADVAHTVVEATEAATVAGRRGLDAIESGVEAMTAIEHRVRTIATEALELSQKSAQIGQIVATVNDLSEQSNVLAVNASVEAAKAGDRGRGFAVVAAEIRRLAEQSKRETLQIRRILGQVQRAVEGVVMATEEGTKRSEEGQRSIGEIRSTVHELATTLEENAESAKRIANSAVGQARGVAELSATLETMVDTGSGASKEAGALQETAASLSSLGAQLEAAIQRFRL